MPAAGRAIEIALVRSATRDALVDVDALTRALGGADAEQLEASVRWGPTSSLVRGNRVMIERASPEVIERVFEALGCTLDGATEALLRAAAAAELPLIGGWDAEGGVVAAKLYANASDLSREPRAVIWRAAGWPDRVGHDVPHLLAVNVPRRGPPTRKAYVQLDDAGAAAAPLGPAAAALAARVEREHLSAGAVTSWDLDPDGAASVRAFFVALRDGSGGPALDLIETLGARASEIDDALPFERGHCRSIGVTLGDAPRWTAYFKPRGLGVPLWDLAPAAVFSTAGADAAVFVAPRDYGPRAYARTAAHAVSYRLTRGSARPDDVDALMRWVTAAVETAERSGTAVSLDAPPEPWLRSA